MEKFINFFHKVKRDVVVAVATTIVISMGERVWNWIATVIPPMGQSLITSFINQRYANVSSYSVSSDLFMIFACATMTIIIILFDKAIPPRVRGSKRGISVITLVFLLSMFWGAAKDQSLWVKFNQDITMIYPYVEEMEIHKLESAWVCMDSKDDYLEIYKYIDAIKEKNNLPD